MDLQSIVPRHDSGKVYLEDQCICWDFNTNNLLKIDISKICVIGEYTTMHALHRNEWFIVFVLQKDEVFQISMYAIGMEDVLAQLSAFFQTRIVGKLGMCTEFKSNVIFPAKLAGEELYELRVIDSKTWFDRFRARLGFGNPLELVLKNNVLELLSQ